ncbi:MAG: hypothetical protein GVY32_07200 [Gammaproteobacteria bacterium]|jgi:hypothetical protein|nr:hypothetical protein [Gammaproteobacteria bacterium]
MWIFRKLFGPIQRFLERRRFPTLFLILAALFGANLLIPDAIPLVDELIMLVATVIVGAFRERRKGRSDDAESSSESQNRGTTEDTEHTEEKTKQEKRP